MASRGGQSASEVGAHCLDRVDIRRDRQRPPDQVNAPTDELRRIGLVAAEDRLAEVGGKPPSGRERPDGVLGLEGVDVEVLYSVPLVEEVECSPLAESNA